MYVVRITVSLRLMTIQIRNPTNTSEEVVGVEEQEVEAEEEVLEIEEVEVLSVRTFLMAPAHMGRRAGLKKIVMMDHLLRCKYAKQEGIFLHAESSLERVLQDAPTPILVDGGILKSASHGTRTGSAGIATVTFCIINSMTMHQEPVSLQREHGMGKSGKRASPEQREHTQVWSHPGSDILTSR